MKKYYFISLIIVFVLIFISCSKDPTSTSDNCFFTIYVKDTNGNPVEGLNVSIMHQLTIDISDKSLSGFNMSREYSNVNGDENIFAYDRAHPCYLEVFYSDGTHPDFETELVSVIATDVTGGGCSTYISTILRDRRLL